MKPILAISIGDYNGIGPEVILKTLFSEIDRPYTPLILGHPAVLEYYAQTALTVKPDFNLINATSQIQPDRVNVWAVGEMEAREIAPGTVSKEAGALSMKAVSKGVELCIAEVTDALVTAPISKEAIHRAGYKVPGHTEYLAEKTNCRDYVMMLVSKALRVGLVSTHIPVRAAADAVTRHAVINQVKIIAQSLENDFNIENPRIAVLGLNPHAGDGGVLGNEEVTVITPALTEVTAAGIPAEGPFPADGFFGSRAYENFDAVLAMYHDQGLIPFKTISFNAGVNFTAGLPIIRTSPDHGTAFALAGQGKASNQSFREAIDLAVQLSRNKHNTQSTFH